MTSYFLHFFQQHQGRNNNVEGTSFAFSTIAIVVGFTEDGHDGVTNPLAVQQTTG